MLLNQQHICDCWVRKQRQNHLWLIAFDHMVNIAKQQDVDPTSLSYFSDKYISSLKSMSVSDSFLASYKASSTTYK